MEGSTQEVTLQLHMNKTTMREGTVEAWCTSGTFHDADIKGDAILACPWLGIRKLEIFPHS